MSIIKEFEAILGPIGVLTDPTDMEPYATDWRKSSHGLPMCVLRPKSTADVSAVMRLCTTRGIAVIPQGGNTGLAAGAVPDSSGSQVIISLSRMTGIRKVDPIGLTIEAEAGCILKSAQDAAAAVNRLLPISLAAEGSAEIGGVVATNAGGINVLRYGMTRQLVLGLEVVRYDGTVINGLRHLRKDNAGYDWKQLFIGSEGTLGIITAAVLRIVPKPKHRVTSLLSVTNCDAAIRLFGLMQNEIGDSISAFELISKHSLAIVSKHFGIQPPIAGSDWFVLLEAGASIPGLRESMEGALALALESGDAGDGVIAESEAQAAQLWALREHITEAELKEGSSVKHDVSVPVTSIPGFIHDATLAIETAFPGANINAFGHAGDGNIHFNVLVRPDHDKSALNRMVHDIVALHAGSISAEHGIGGYRLAELERYKAPEEIGLLKEIKAMADPTGILNPGKVLRMSSSLT